MCLKIEDIKVQFPTKRLILIIRLINKVLKLNRKGNKALFMKPVLKAKQFNVKNVRNILLKLHNFKEKLMFESSS